MKTKYVYYPYLDGILKYELLILDTQMIPYQHEENQHEENMVLSSMLNLFNRYF